MDLRWLQWYVFHIANFLFSSPYTSCSWSAAEHDNNNQHTSITKERRGPICWKCKGTCSRPQKKDKKMKQKLIIKQNESSNTEIDTATRAVPQRPCPVCKGQGRLQIKSKYLQSQTIPGVITSRRRRPNGWKEFGHVPSSIQAALAFDVGSNITSDDDTKNNNDIDDTNGIDLAISFLCQANGHDDDYKSQRKDIPVNAALIPVEKNKNTIPTWLPINPGEQLCNLVGRWRILQCVASHRWTTDDLVTAYIAASTYVTLQRSRMDADIMSSSRKPSTIRYLDLGTGNGSVLQMVSWYLLSTFQQHGMGTLEAVGVEARSEAVGLARRSLSFNLGSVEYKGALYTGGCSDSSSTNGIDHDVQIVQGDFRNLVALSNNDDTAVMEDGASSMKMQDVASKQYDLITGTPPYFRVGFTSTKGNCDATATNGSDEITSAVIEQGGMPTSMQSAPARCEFRGGIEAYCLTASSMLAQNGRFVVCENWLNDKRVWNGAKEAGLAIEDVQPVRGSVKKEHNLFAVYVMKKADTVEVAQAADEQDSLVVQDPLVVRLDESGKYTAEYTILLDSMSIPVV